MDRDGTWIDEEPYPGPVSTPGFHEALEAAFGDIGRAYVAAGRAFGKAIVSRQFLEALKKAFPDIIVVEAGGANDYPPRRNSESGLFEGDYQKQYINQVDHSHVPHLRYMDRSRGTTHRAWKHSRR